MAIHGAGEKVFWFFFLKNKTSSYFRFTLHRALAALALSGRAHYATGGMRRHPGTKEVALMVHVPVSEVPPLDKIPAKPAPREHA